MREVGLWEAVSGLPSGLDSELAEDGVLSAGERQLLCLARALLMTRCGASVFLMDEATSSCDDGTDRCVQGTLAGMQGSITTLVIAHRLQTVADADVIIALDAGRVFFCGPPADIFVQDPCGAGVRFRSELLPGSIESQKAPLGQISSVDAGCDAADIDLSHLLARQFSSSPWDDRNGRKTKSPCISPLFLAGSVATVCCPAGGVRSAKAGPEFSSVVSVAEP